MNDKKPDKKEGSKIKDSKKDQPSSLSTITSYSEFVPQQSKEASPDKKNLKKRSFNKKGKKGGEKKESDVAQQSKPSSLSEVNTYKEFVPQNVTTPAPIAPTQKQEVADDKTAKPKPQGNKRRNGNKKPAPKKEQSAEQKEQSTAEPKEEVQPTSKPEAQPTPKPEGAKKPRKPRTRKSKATPTPEETAPLTTEGQPDIQPPQPKPRRNRNNNRKQIQLLRSDSQTTDAMSVISTVSTASTATVDLPLREKLEKELLKQRYFCPICMDVVRRHQLIWSCRECFCVIHLQCMKQWVFQNLDQATQDQLPKLARDPAKFLGYLHNHGTPSVITRCPVCRGEQQIPCILSGCYCGHGMINKKNADEVMSDVMTPHCCGKLCGHERGNGCTHPCNMLCHPGPCPPCSAIITVSCQCGRSTQSVRCGTDPATIHCEEVCGKLLNCQEHTCNLVCHSGPCPSCSIPVDCKCYCGAEKKVLPCGETKMAICSRNPNYDPDLLIETKATLGEGQVNANLYNNDDILGDLDGLSDLSDSEEDAEVEVKEIKVEEKAKKPFALLPIRVAGIGAFSCGAICGKVLPCQRHRCDKQCHPNNCGICPLTVTDTTTCPCGKHLAKEVNPAWSSCADPFPCCGEVCGKLLACGKHKCPYKCHVGPCPTCEVSCPQKCRCTYTERQAPCWVVHNLPAPAGITKEREEELRSQFICTRVCKTDCNCRRHKCEEICCPYKGKKSDGTFHICHRPCGKVLNCGKHTCYLPCHTGDCVPCGHIITTPVTCACGKQVIQPPTPCGTLPPKCTEPCMKPCPRGHLSKTHTCHFGPCPPCVVLTERMCEGGHGLVKGVPCYREKVFCNRVCGKTLPCGHICQRTCHEPPCIDEHQCMEQGCGQICGKKREFCEHTCQAPCHPGQPCPNLPCMFDVEVRCPCGRRSEKQKCLIGVSGEETVLQDLSQRSLECDSECRIIQRNRRLAEALNVGPARLNLPESELMRAYEVELQNCPYTKSTLCTANLNSEFVTWLETACDAIVRTSQSQPIAVPYQYTQYQSAIQDVVKEYGITLGKVGTILTLVPSESMKRPGIFLSEAIIRFESLVDGSRLHPAQPLPKYATERDFATLFIHNRKGMCKTESGLMNYLQPYLPANQYKIKTWLKPDGLLILFNTEETARRVKMDLEMREAEFDVDFWAVRPPENTERVERKVEVKQPQVLVKEKETLDSSNSFAALSEE